MPARPIPTAVLAIALLVVAAGDAGYAQSPERVSASVKERLAAEGRARVLVELAVADESRGAGRRTAGGKLERRAAIAAQRAQLRALLGRGGHRVMHEFADAPFVSLEVDAATLAKLESAPAIAVRVLEDRLLRPSLADSVPRIDATRAHAAGLDGAGMAVAVVDSGVDRNHPFYADRLVAEACFASAPSGSGGSCPNGQATQVGSGAAAACTFAPQACRHGTHVAGIAVGDGAAFSGVAPAADLIAVQVFHASTDCLIFFEEFPCPRAFESDIVAGLEHVYSLRNQYDIAAVNLSLGGTAYDGPCDAESPLFAAAIDNLKSAGIATVAASGNDGLTTGISEPACIDAAVSVGATDANDDVAWFSNASVDLDLLAPGTPITSSVPGGGFDTLQGTSMAAPHVAGAWAVYRQANPTATVDEALASLAATGLPLEDWRSGLIRPRIRVAVAAGVPSPAPDLDAVSPGSIARFGPDFTVTVDGSGFVPASAVQADGVPLPTTYIDDTRLAARIPAAAIAGSAATLAITVHTPPPGGGTTVAASIALLDPSVAVDSTVVSPGGTVNATAVNPPGWSGDWLALAEVGSPATSYIAYAYLHSTPTWSVAMPQAPGEYEIRLFVNDSYTQVAVSAPILVEATVPEPGTTTLTPNATEAAPGAAVTVTVADAPGGANDWLALARVGSAAGSYVAYTYVGAGVTDRTWTVNMPQTPGDYEFRLFANNGYSQLAVSPPVTVSTPPPNPASPTLTPDRTSAAPGEAVTVTLAAAPGGANDWLALARVGSPATSYVSYTYVGTGITDRTWTATMPQSEGQYEFRLFANNGYTQLAVSPAVTVAAPAPVPGSATLTPDKTDAAPGEAVTVTLSGAPGGVNDWLALARVGSPATSYLAYTYVGTGITDRTWTVNLPQDEGQYEFRLFANDGYNQLAVSPAVTVVAPEPQPGTATLTPDTTAAAPGDSVTVTLAGAPGGNGDWLALARVGSPATSYVSYTYVGTGITDRTWTVTMPQSEGQFEFRLFANNGYTQLAASVPVTVAVPEPDPTNVTLAPDTASTSPGSPVTVTLANAPGGAGDWLALARVGSATTTYVTYTYVGAGVTARTWTVPMPQTAGAYEFRLFLNHGYTQFAASPPVLVE